MNRKHILELFAAFKQRDIRAVVWKNFAEIDDALDAKSDLDLLIPESDWRNARLVLLERGFVRAENFVVEFPNVYHYFGLVDGEILHLNIYTRLVTGESQTKLYDLPLVDRLIDSAGYHFHNSVLTSSPSVSLHLFLLRYFIKISSLSSLLRYAIDRSDYKSEAERILKHDVNSLVDESPVTGGLSNKELLWVFQNQSFSRQLLFGLLVKIRLIGFSRCSPLRGFAFRYWQVAKRIANKMFFKRKKRLKKGGAIIALTGLDGAGKSTSVNSLRGFFATHFDCESLHLGRPEPVLLSLPVRAALKVRGMMIKQRPMPSTQGRSDKESSAIAAIRYVILAMERFHVMQRALRARSVGKIVVLDRYPSQSFNKMDGPRIVSLKRSKFVRVMSQIERWFYTSMPTADLLMVLEVPVEVALQRNRDRIKKDKESDDEIIQRHAHNRDLEYLAMKVQSVDMNRSPQETMGDIRALAWRALN